MAYSKSREVAAVVLVVVLALACMAVGEAAISCATVSSDMAPCLSYLTAAGGSPTARCCSGVKSLYAATKAVRADRVTACGCIKSLSGALGGKLNGGQVSSLPGACGVSLGYTPSLNTNCNAIP